MVVKKDATASFKDCLLYVHAPRTQAIPVKDIKTCQVLLFGGFLICTLFNTVNTFSYIASLPYGPL